MRPRAKTVEEAKMEILNHIKNMADYWETDVKNVSIRYRLHGIIFSILAMFDGEDGKLPTMDIVMSPHPDDEEWHKGNGDNWFPFGLTLEDGDLHEIWSNLDK